MNALKRFNLLDPNKVKNDRIEKNQLKYFLGGYSGELYCKVTWEEGLNEEGFCGFSTEEKCCEKIEEKYPLDWFGPVTYCHCE